MRIDLGNVVGPGPSPGVSRDRLDELDEAVAEAHDRIVAGRADDEFGYAALNLPSAVDAGAIDTAVEPLSGANTVLTIGIGGSALGARTVTAALGGEHYTLDNVDPAATRSLLDRLEFDDLALHVVSRSGTTVETLANFLVVREAMDAAGVDWTSRTLVTTGETGPLDRLADKYDLSRLPVPAGVPGRFSALSSMGLVPAAILGHDVGTILNGAAAVANGLEGSLFDCPPYAYGAVTTELARSGATVNAMMPYAETLEVFAEWFAQLWAESLGKEGNGQFPVRALGATDQHSQLQLYRAGPPSSVVTFVDPGSRPTVPIPDPEAGELAYLRGQSMGDVIDTELQATEASLAEAGRPSIRLDIDAVDPAGIGDLLYSMEAACVMAGELWGVNAFDQPAVEWGKTAARDLLEGADTAATRAVRDRDSFEIG
jgi:glucose-6-phosphate isomerase